MNNNGNKPLMFVEGGSDFSPALLLFGASIKGKTLTAEAFHARRAFSGLMVEVEAIEQTDEYEGRKRRFITYQPKENGLRFTNDSPATPLVFGRLELQLDLEEASI